MKLMNGDIVNLKAEVTQVSDQGTYFKYIGSLLDTNGNRTEMSVYFYAHLNVQSVEFVQRGPEVGDIWEPRITSEGDTRQWRVGAIVEGIVFGFYRQAPNLAWRPSSIPAPVLEFAKNRKLVRK